MIQVECVPNSAGEAEPVVLCFGARRVQVRAVTDRWYGTTQRWWKVDTAEGAYIVRRDEQSGQWELAAVVGG